MTIVVVLARPFVASGASYNELQRAEPPNANGASQSSRKRAVVHLKLGTRQNTHPHITTTVNYTEHGNKTVHETDNILGLGTADRGARGGGRGFKASANGHYKSPKNGYLVDKCF